MKQATVWIISLVAFLFAACAQKKGEQSAKIKAFVSILPQKAFVEKIAKNRVEVHVMVRPGFSPATYEPLPRQMELLSESDLYFRLHVPFERAWMGKIQKNNPRLKLIDTSEGIRLRPMEETVHLQPAENKTHDHHHEKGRKDPHIWLSPNLVKTQAQNIAKAFMDHDPDHRAFYKKNLALFKQELDRLHDKIASVLKPVKQKKILVFHPAWGYFAREFGLKQVPIELRGHKPGAKALGQIIEYAKKEDLKIVFVQKQFSTKEAQTVAEAIDGRVVKIDPLAPNYIENMLLIAKTLADHL